MKRFLSLFNCVHFYSGLIFLALAVWSVWWIFHILQVSDQLGLSIIYSVVLVFAIFGCLVESFDRFKKAYKFTKEYSKRS